MRTRTETRTAAAAAMMLTVLVCGCGDGIGPPRPSPAAPTPPPVLFPVGDLYTLHGVVYEITAAGRKPVEGVQVYCERCGPPEGHSSRDTDGNGYYSFSGVANGSTDVLLAKRGYGLPDQPGVGDDGWMGVANTVVTGDTRLDIQVVRR